MNHALIVGATGLTGSALLEICLESAFFHQVTVISRRALAREHPKLRVHILDNFANLDQLRLPFGDDDIYGFCCLGTTIKKAGSQRDFALVDRDYVMAFARLCKHESAQHLSVVSSQGASRWSGAFYLRLKGEVERLLKSLGLKSLSIVRPALLLGERQEKRPGEDFIKRLAPMIFGPWRPIEAFQVAFAMYTIAKKHEPGAKVYKSSLLRSLSAL